MALRRKSQEKIVTTFSDWVFTGHHETDGHVGAWGAPEHPAKKHEVRERLREIPVEDTRSLTGRLMNDPDPSDRRRQPMTTREA
jgi:hypothetical protein